ncbi:MAG: type II secretion system major pseudopilin GspG [Phycisphaerales bacterium]
MNGNTHLTRPHRSGRHTRRGFTLVEILVVVTIIALLAGMVSLRLFGIVGQTRSQVAQNDATAVAKAINVFILNGGSLEDGMDLTVLTLPPDQGGGPSGPYLNRADDILDPWGKPFYVRVPGEVNYDFDVISYGKDGQPGGEGENADIVHE